MFRGNTIGAVAAAIMSLVTLFSASGADIASIEEACTAAVCTSLRTKAEHGDLDAALSLGGLYLYGTGVPIDNAEALKTRLWAYYKETSPLVGYYYRSGILVSLDAMAPVAKVTAAIEKALK